MCIEFQHLRGHVLVIKGLAYLFILVFLENSENDSKLNDWINFGIYWKNLLSHSRPCPWPCMSVALALTPLALLTSLLLHRLIIHFYLIDDQRPSRIYLLQLATYYKTHADNT